jgi:hypothetical protein
MESSFLHELIGYAGSILVAISLMMKSLVRLRFINLVGALFFTVYGFLIGALPVVFLNMLIVAINVYYLLQMWNQKDYFKLMEVFYDSRYLRNFVDFYQKEIKEVFPSYLFKPQSDQLAVFVLRNMVPAGVLIIKPQGEQAEVFLDYVIPDYRDFRAGRFLFDESSEYFQQKGIKQFVSEAGNARHEAYLKRMGFQVENGVYYYALPAKVMKEKSL